MGKLINEFTWSVSRHGLFAECRRAYYYNYYGSWGGWESDAPPATRQLYLLKNLKTMEMWAGSLVHEVIADALGRYARTGHAIAAGELQAQARQKLRAGWVEAVNGDWRKNAKKTNLFELYYGNGRSLPPEHTERIKARVFDCLANFAEAAVLQEILSVPYLQWKPIDKLDSFIMDAVKIWCALDFACTDAAGTLRIIDWKTGSEDSEALKLQLACYAFFASERWMVRPDMVRVSGIFLREKARCSDYAMAPDVLVDARDRILMSAAQMRELLMDIEKNAAREADFAFCQSPRSCQRCNFREVCPQGKQVAPRAPAEPPTAVL